jgi:MoaA/NifB/PqqE/SkfB family radical SAM enzyme
MMFFEWNKTARYLYSRYKDIPSPSTPDPPGAESGIMCLQPFYFAEITTNGDIYTCCPGWIRFPIGNIKSNTIAEIWNSSRALYIRKKIYRGEWRTVCNAICPNVAHYLYQKKSVSYDSLETLDYLSPHLVEEIRSKKERLDSLPTVFNLSNSTQCNLSCIMCDRHNQKDDPRVIQKTARDVSRYLPAARRLILTGMGDPFARPDTRQLLTEFKSQNPDFAFDIVTNGLLLPRYWDRIRHQRFGSLLISVDASKKETYDKIRIGGSWDRLIESLDLVKENRDRFSSVTLNMTVMRHNYGEVPEFIGLAESYGFSVSFQRIRGRNGQNFFGLKDKSLVDEFKTILQKEQCGDRGINIFWGDLVGFVEGSAGKTGGLSEETILPENDKTHSEEDTETEIPVDSVVAKLKEDVPLFDDDGAGGEINMSEDGKMHLEEAKEMEVDMDSIVAKLQKDAPLFHDDGAGGLTTWFSNISLLTALERLASPGMRTMETGSGYSTLVFLSRQCSHTCIVPIKEEIERIKEYCSKTGISLEGSEFMINESHNVLPSYPDRDFDLFFLDGAHRFPFPIIDWFYGAILLKENGLMVVDDTDIISCHILCKFMLSDSHWEPVEVKENFGIFKKMGGHDYPLDWHGQIFSRNKIESEKAILKILSPFQDISSR